MFNQLEDNNAYYYCDYYGFQHESPTKYSHLLNNTFYFMVMYFFKLDLMYVQCKIRCIAIVTININAVHSWIVIRKCLMETNTLPLASYPLGNTNQFNRPVMLNKIKRIKDKTLTVQSLKAFLLFINFHLGIKKGSYRSVKILGLMFLPYIAKRTCPPIFVVEIYPPLEDPVIGGYTASSTFADFIPLLVVYQKQIHKCLFLKERRSIFVNS